MDETVIKGPLDVFLQSLGTGIQNVFYPHRQEFRPRVSEPPGRVGIAVQNLAGSDVGDIDRFGGVFDDGAEVVLACGDLLQCLFEFGGGFL